MESRQAARRLVKSGGICMEGSGLRPPTRRDETKQQSGIAARIYSWGRRTWDVIRAVLRYVVICDEETAAQNS